MQCPRDSIGAVLLNSKTHPGEIWLLNSLSWGKSARASHKKKPYTSHTHSQRPCTAQDSAGVCIWPAIFSNANLILDISRCKRPHSLHLASSPGCFVFSVLANNFASTRLQRMLSIPQSIFESQDQVLLFYMNTGSFSSGNESPCQPSCSRRALGADKTALSIKAA